MATPKRLVGDIAVIVMGPTGKGKTTILYLIEQALRSAGFSTRYSCPEVAEQQQHAEELGFLKERIQTLIDRGTEIVLDERGSKVTRE